MNIACIALRSICLQQILFNIYKFHLAGNIKGFISYNYPHYSIGENKRGEVVILTGYIQEFELVAGKETVMMLRLYGALFFFITFRVNALPKTLIFDKKPLS